MHTEVQTKEVQIKEVQTKEDVSEYLQKNGVTFVNLWFADIHRTTQELQRL